MEQTELREFAEEMIRMGKRILASLDGVEEKKLERRSNPDIRAFINWWCGEYQTRFNVPYHVNYGKDGATVKRLLVTYPLEKLCEGAVKFLDSKDDFITKNRTIGFFSMRVSPLLIEPRLKTMAEILSEKYARNNKR